MYPDDFHVDIDYEPRINDVSYWKKYQIVHAHRTIGQDYNISAQLIEFIKSLGIVVIVDLDDYWLPTVEHPIHSIIVQNKIDERIKSNLRAASYVTTTTQIFADEIKKLNRNVEVFPNAINPNELQFNQPTPPSDKIRVGWLGGSSHLHDLGLLGDFVQKNSDINDKLQYVICGFDTRGTVTEINPQTNEQKQRDIRPEETVWARYEELFTSNYKTVDDEYKKHLLEFKEGDYVSNNELPYVRVWTKPVTTYAMNYSKFDISLAPIKNHIFNRMKSQLKVIEAGFYKKALIASEIGPYTIDLVHCLKNGEFNEEGNAILIPENRNHSDWSKAIKKLVQNPEMIKELGERLYNTVKDKYDLNIVTKNRRDFYLSLIK
jgi:glycosyltransferase involved in cell wall biosynthesis